MEKCFVEKMIVLVLGRRSKSNCWGFLEQWSGRRVGIGDMLDPYPFIFGSLRL